MDNKKQQTKKDKSHFIMIPFETSEFIDYYEKFVVDTSESLKISRDLYQKPGKLHLTVSFLNCEEEGNVEKVKDLLQELEPECQKITKGSLYFEPFDLDVFGKENQANVLFLEAKINENMEKLNKLAHLVISRLFENNLISTEELKKFKIQKSKGQYSIKYHLTLLNNLFLVKMQRKRREKPSRGFDATQLLERATEFVFPIVELPYVAFCVMQEDKKTEILS